MGRSRTPYARILKPDYGDGIETVKMSHSGKELPNARRITRTLMTTEVRNIKTNFKNGISSKA